ncbi:MAG TPA: hypothetical protein VN633_22240 [Bryobacteraceae bacterium]|nr:hypothetical protein [Bryobacteraceae bacterium]
MLCFSALIAVALSTRAAEPSYEQAVADMRRPITFLGCKNQPLEFEVVWNGNISATPGELLTEAD